MSTRSKLRDFLNRDYPSSNAAGLGMISFVSDTDDSGEAGVLDERDDLGIEPGTGAEMLSLQNPTESGGLLGDFARFLVDLSNSGQQGSAFVVTDGNEPSISSNRGESLDIAYGGVEESFTQVIDNVLIGKGKPTLGATMSGYSQSGYIENTGDLNLSNLKTGRGEVTFKGQSLSESEYETSGHTLLATIAGEDLGTTDSLGENQVPESVVEDAVEEMLARNNAFRGISGGRFSSFINPDRKNAQLFEESEGTGPDGTLAMQNSFGEYIKNDEEPFSSFGAGAANRMPIDQLKSLGASLMLKAAGWDTSETPGGSNPDIDPFDPSTESNLDSASKYDTGAQSAYKIDGDALRAKNAYGAPTVSDAVDTSPRAGRGEVIDFEPALSYGTMTTPDIPFSDSASQEILTAQASAAINAMLLLAKETYKSAFQDVQNFDLGRGPYHAGYSRLVGRTAVAELFKSLIMVPTEYAYTDSIRQGFLVMFNRDIEESGEANVNKKEGKDSANWQGVSESPGFWLAVARKFLRTFAEFNASITSGDESYESPKSTNFWKSIYDITAGNGVVGMLNVAAQVGDAYLRSNGGKIGNSQLSPTSRWNVDALPDGPGTRVSKSRSQSGQTALSLAWRGSSVPSIYTIPRNVIFAALEMGSMGRGANPAKGMLGSQLIEKTYVDVFAGGAGEGGGKEGGFIDALTGFSSAKSARIPTFLIEQIENQLDAEYVPFYFHDIRTNEIVAFHAFLDSLTDRYTPSWTSSSGYGRVDQVKVYRDTRRAVGFSFYVAATSKEDFDEMWWKINKLTTLVYPSWTDGVTLQNDELESTFKMPFSQVLGASPLIRLRIGDVIKSNYSRFNLARIFGVGQDGITPRAAADNISLLSALGNAAGAKSFIRIANELQFETVFNLMFGSPISWLSLLPEGTPRDVMRGSTALLFNLMGGGFTNPLGVGYVMKKLLSPDVDVNAIPTNATLSGAVESAAGRLLGFSSDQREFGYKEWDYPYLKASMDDGYMTTDGKRVRIPRPIRVKVISSATDDIASPSSVSTFDKPFKGETRKANPKYKTYYKVAVVDANTGLGFLGKNRTELRVTHSDLMPNINTMFNTRVLPFLSITAAAEAIVQSLAAEAATITGIPADIIGGLINTTDTANFMKPENNPITRAFESAGGRGLAGVITSLNYTWIDAQNTWEIDWNSRAPMVAKIDVSFDAIHDIPPGLDANGYNRAPIYNVGEIMRYVAGDPYPDSGQASRDSYTAAGRFGNSVEDDMAEGVAAGGDDAKKSAKYPSGI